MVCKIINYKVDRDHRVVTIRAADRWETTSPSVGGLAHRGAQTGRGISAAPERCTVQLSAATKRLCLALPLAFSFCRVRQHRALVCN